MITRYIFRELARSIIVIFFLSMIVASVIIFFITYKTFQMVGLEFVIKLAPPVLGYIMPYALLISSVLGTTLCYSRMSSENEITAMKTSGVHAIKIIYPAIAVGILLAAVSYYINDYIAPSSLSERRRIEKQAINQQLLNPPPSKQTFEIGENKEHLISYAHASEGNFKIVSIDDLEQNRVIVAREGKANITSEGELVIYLKDGFGRPKDVIGKNYSDGGGKVSTFRPFRKQQEKEKAKEGSKYIHSLDLIFQFTGDYPKKEKIEAKTEYFLRQSNSISTFTLVVISALIGIFVKSSSRLAGLGAAIPIFLGYLVLSKHFEGHALTGHMNPFIAVYYPTAIMTLLSLFLYKRIRK